tara:strand:- start:40 stop:303 length:264 start_codon:yes stop_codon:yes gene_type:complete
MDEKPTFGHVSAEALHIGDIVEWTKWADVAKDWVSHYGIIMEIKNEVRGNRLVSVSIVVPLAGPPMELKFFTPSLKLISHGEDPTEQ